MSEESRLAAMRDGVVLGEAEARELWKEFSAHMDANKGDMTGFARSKGWYAVVPEYREGKAVLLVTTTEGVAVVKPAVTVKAQAKAAPGMKPKAKAPPRSKGGGKPRR